MISASVLRLRRTVFLEKTSRLRFFPLLVAVAPYTPIGPVERPFPVHTVTVTTLDSLLAYVISFLRSRSSTTSASFPFSVLSPI